jgi:hypothetical protein
VAEATRRFVLKQKMTRKRKSVRVGETKIRAATASEHKRIEARIRKRHETLRKKYQEIHGKVVDWVSHNVEEHSLYVNIRFKDKTEFSLRFSPGIETDYVDLSDISKGDFKLIREYYKRQDL